MVYKHVEVKCIVKCKTRKINHSFFMIERDCKHHLHCEISCWSRNYHCDIAEIYKEKPVLYTSKVIYHVRKL